MKKKIPIIIAGIIGVILLAIVVSLAIIKLINQKNADLTVVFDSVGGTAVEKLKVKKGSEIVLPSTTKEGFNFLGWYDENNHKAGNKVKITKYTKFTAQWEEVPKNNSFTVTFDSAGGSEVGKIVVECGKELNLPTIPTRDGYTFVTWQDKNATPINDKALLACEDITLTAKWEKKEETKKEETKKEETPKEEPKKEYTCPDGYTLNGTKCSTPPTAAKEKCPDGTKTISGGICATITGTARKDYEKSCKKQHVTYNSFAGEVDGKVVNWGITGCAYYKTNDTNQSNCESHGFKWVTPENACYVKWDTTTVIKVCTQSGYVDVPNPNIYVTNTGLNAGCYPTSSKVQYCDEGYDLTNGSCIKTIDATLK